MRSTAHPWFAVRRTAMAGQGVLAALAIVMAAGCSGDDRQEIESAAVSLDTCTCHIN